MSTQIQHRRGTAAQHEAFTGAMSEITHDTTNNNLRVHDGQKPGGYATLMEDQLGVAGGVATLDETGNVPGDQLLNASTPTVSSYAELKSTPVAEKEKVAFLTLAGSEGTFFWKLGDFSQKIDDENYVASDHHPATVGAWVRSSIHAPYVLPTFRGLKISEFLTNNDAWETPKTSALQEAMSAMAENARYGGIDLEGRLLVIDSPVTLGNAPLFYPHKYIANGYVHASTDFPIGKYLFDFYENPDLRNFRFANVSFNGNERGGWVHAPYQYKYFAFDSCSFFSGFGSGDVAATGVSGKTYGFYDPSKPTGGSHELFFNGCYWDSADYGPASGRNQVGCFTNNPDVVWANNLAQYFDEWVLARSGSYQFIGNHVWAPSDGVRSGVLAHLPNCVSGLGAIFSGNYIDGVTTILSNKDDPTKAISGVSFSGNFFLHIPGAPNNFYFVTLMPYASNTKVNAITMSGNVYDANGGNTFYNIGVNTANGTIDPDGIQRFDLLDTSLDISQNGRILQSSPSYSGAIAAEDNGYKFFDFADQIPSFAKIKKIKNAQFSRNGGSGVIGFAVPSINSAAPRTGVDVTIANGSIVTNAVGRIDVTVDINSDNYQ